MSKSTISKFMDSEDWINIILFIGFLAIVGVLTLAAVLTVLKLFGVM